MCFWAAEMPIVYLAARGRTAMNSSRICRDKMVGFIWPAERPKLVKVRCLQNRDQGQEALKLNNQIEAQFHTLKSWMIWWTLNWTKRKGMSSVIDRKVLSGWGEKKLISWKREDLLVARWVPYRPGTKSLRSQTYFYRRKSSQSDSLYKMECAIISQEIFN